MCIRDSRPHNGDLVLLRQRLRQGQRPALAGPLADDPQLLHVLQVKMDGGGGFQPHGVPNFPHGGGIALRPDGLGDIVIDPLLHLRELYLSLIHILGSGPYRYAKDESGVYLARRTDWWQDKTIPLERIELTACKNTDSMAYAFYTHDIQMLVCDLTGTCLLYTSHRHHTGG